MGFGFFFEILFKFFNAIFNGFYVPERVVLWMGVLKTLMADFYLLN